MRLHPLDLGLIVLYLIGITLFGLRFRKPTDTSLSSYFLAARSVPWWAIALSIVSAETSTLTIISIPGVAFGGNFTFLQLVFGYMIGRLLICLLFLPRYFEGELFTAYQLIDRRFGAVLHKVTAALFLLVRAAAEGVRVYAVSIVVGLAIGTNDIASIIIISMLTLVYTFEGGMAAVIWTDVIQMGLYVAGTIIALFTLGGKISGGWSAVHAIAGGAGKLQVFDFTLNLTSTYTFWAGVIGGAFLTMASHGTDQLMVQRLLAAKNLREARVSLLASGGVVLLQFTLFLVIGAGLFVFYGQHPDLLTVKGSDRLFPAFIVQQMPTGIAGLLIAAILAAAMSNLSAALNSLSSTTIVDFYLKLRPNASDTRRNLLSRTATLVWAAVLVAIAIYSVKVGGKGHVVEMGLSIASVAYGALLGVFLLGTLTRYATEFGATVGMIVGFAANLALYLPKITPLHSLHMGAFALSDIAYTWYVLIGSAVTFAVGSLLSVGGARKRSVAATAVLLLCVTSSHAQADNFSEVDAVMQQGLKDRLLPGGVVAIGSNGRVVYQKAYGNRAEDPAVEPMTEDTVFDMASLSKCMSTSVAIMQLYEQGKLAFDDPVVKYLPEFGAAGKSNITVRQLLTHYSGLAPDVSLKDAWSGKAEGVKRAMESVPAGPPGVKFVYSDINFITLGAIVEKLSGEPLDVYATRHIFAPLRMTETGYFTPHCPHVYWQIESSVPSGGRNECVVQLADPRTHKRLPLNLPNGGTIKPDRIAPTAHNDDKPMDDDRMLRGEVHDPTTRRMGGVAGHAGVFSTVHDTELFAQALLDRLAGRPSTFPLTQATLRLMCQPEQPAGAKALRGFGWDIDSPYSRPRGDIYPVGSFGHTGFTGTSVWMDPRSNSYVILLANAVHPRGRPPVTPLRGKLATAAARALGLDKPIAGKDTRTGIDVLEATQFKALHDLPARTPGHLKLGLLTNNTGLDRTGKRTIDVLYAQRSSGIELTTLFAPEHGILGAEDHEGISNATDAATHLPVISLYGEKLADRYPKLDDLAKLDAVLIDLQDIPARFYTYETEMGYVMESAAKAGVAVVVLDRPAMISGVNVTGPVSDLSTVQSYINYLPEPMSLGMTMGELAGFFNGEKHLGVKLSVVQMQNWQRGLWYDQTGLPWVNPSPNLQSMRAVSLYTGTAFAEYTNLSVGRGTDAAFEQVGAPWITTDADAQMLAATLNARKLVGVTFAPVTFTPAKPYSYAGQTIHGIRITAKDRTRLDAPAMGAELLAAVHAQYPAAFDMTRAQKLVLNQATTSAIAAGKDPHEIVAAWEPELARFRELRTRYLLYGYLPQ